MIIINNEEYIDLDETAKLLNVASTTIRVRTRAKEMPKPIKLKTLTYWKRSEIDTYLEQTRSKQQ